MYRTGLENCQGTRSIPPLLGRSQVQGDGVDLLFSLLRRLKLLEGMRSDN